MKDFEDQLYASVACVLPDLTVRKMSKIMGKSEGYWSSLMARGLPVSNDALCCLISFLETRKVIGASTPDFNKRVACAQRFISQEIVKRFNTEYWEYVHQAQDPAEDYRHRTETSRGDPMPFIVSHY
jgi:hypothetical protein